MHSRAIATVPVGYGVGYQRDPMTQERERLRDFYGQVWRKQRAGLALEPLERLIAGVILQHPEYHPLLDAPDAVHQEFTPEFGETNPFLHMGLHIAIREQLGADRPAGIRKLLQALRAAFTDEHQLEHQVMECLGETLWKAQREGRTPDEEAYLECVRRLARGQG